MTEPRLTKTGLPLVSRETISGLQHDIMSSSPAEQLLKLLKENPVVGEAITALSGQFSDPTEKAKAVQAMLAIYRLVDREAEKNQINKNINLGE